MQPAIVVNICLNIINMADKIIEKVYNDFYGSIKDTYDARKIDKSIKYDNVKKMV